MLVSTLFNFLERNELIKKIRSSTAIANQLIKDLQLRDTENITFKQEGILNGQEIIEEYLAVNEIGLAYEHLLYIINESDIEFPADDLDDLFETAKKCGIDTN